MKNQNSIYGYLIVAIVGAFLCFMILNTLGWQKPGKAQQIKPTRQKVEASNMLIKRNVPPGATIFVMSDSTLYMSTEYGRYILELQNESSALIKVYK